MSEEQDIQIIDFTKATKKKATKKKEGASKVDKAADIGDKEKADAEASKKVSLLVAEGHVTYEYNDLLERISK
jgi:hypothetical protein